MGFLRFLLSPFRGAVWLYVVLFLFFFAVGAVALLCGFSLGDVDNWLDANGGWIETIGSLLFRLFCAFVLLMCAAIVAVCVYEGIDGIRRRRRADATRARKKSKSRFWRRNHALPPGAKPAREEGESCLGLGCMAMAALLIGYFAWFGVFY